MALYEVEHNGSKYQVQADSAEHAAAAFDPPAAAPDRRADAPAGTFVDPHTGQPATTSQPSDPEGGNWLAGAGRRVAEPLVRAAEGAGDLVGAFARKDAQAGYKSQVDARNAAYDQANPQDSPAVNDALGAAASSAIPIGAATKTTTLMGAIAKGMGVGATSAALQYTKPGDSKAQQVGIGAGAGGVFATLGAAIPAAKNVVTRVIQRAENNPRVKEVVDAAKGFFTGSARVPTPMPYTIPQASASPALERLTGRAFGPQQQELGATQADQARTRFSEIADQASSIAKIPATSQAVVESVNTALNQTVTGLRQARTAAFQKGMTATLAADAAAPGTTVGLDNLRQAYADVISQDGNAFNIHGKTLPKSFQTTLDLLSPTTAGAAKVTAVRIPTLQYIMQGLGQDAQHGAGTFMSPADARLERYRKMLFDGLQQDIDAAGVKAGSNPAYAQLKATRQAYAQHSDQLRQIENDSITKLFGSPEAVQNPAQALDKFYALKPDDQKFAVTLLNNRSPATVEAMRSHQINTALQQATMAGNAKNSTFDLATFNETMFGQGRGDSPLWQGSGTTPGSVDVTARSVRQGAAHLRVLLNATPAGPGSVVGPEDLAINVIAANPAFLGRFVTRVVYGAKGDQLLGTPEGLAALRTLSNTTSRKSQAYGAAVSYIVNLARSGGGTDPDATPQ